MRPHINRLSKGCWASPVTCEVEDKGLTQTLHPHFAQSPPHEQPWGSTSLARGSRRPTRHPLLSRPTPYTQLLGSSSRDRQVTDPSSEHPQLSVVKPPLQGGAARRGKARRRQPEHAGCPSQHRLLCLQAQVSMLTEEGQHFVLFC